MKVQESPAKVPWKRSFSLTPPPPKDAAEEKRFALRSNAKFKQWLQDADAKLEHLEALRRESF